MDEHLKQGSVQLNEWEQVVNIQEAAKNVRKSGVVIAMHVLYKAVHP